MGRSLDSCQLSPPARGFGPGLVHGALPPELGTMNCGRGLCVTCQGLCDGRDCGVFALVTLWVPMVFHTL